MSVTKKISVRIKPDGSYILETKEGFAGSSCQEETMGLEQQIGGDVVASSVKPEFYDSDDGEKAFINNI